MFLTSKSMMLKGGANASVIVLPNNFISTLNASAGQIFSSAAISAPKIVLNANGSNVIFTLGAQNQFGTPTILTANTSTGNIISSYYVGGTGFALDTNGTYYIDELDRKMYMSKTLGKFAIVDPGAANVTTRSIGIQTRQGSNSGQSTGFAYRDGYYYSFQIDLVMTGCTTCGPTFEYFNAWTKATSLANLGSLVFSSPSWGKYEAASGISTDSLRPRIDSSGNMYVLWDAFGGSGGGFSSLPSITRLYSANGNMTVFQYSSSSTTITATSTNIAEDRYFGNKFTIDSSNSIYFPTSTAATYTFGTSLIKAHANGAPAWGIYDGVYTGTTRGSHSTVRAGADGYIYKIATLPTAGAGFNANNLLSIMKLNAQSGTLIWQRTLGWYDTRYTLPTASAAVTLADIAVTSDGQMYIIANFSQFQSSAYRSRNALISLPASGANTGSWTSGNDYFTYATSSYTTTAITGLSVTAYSGFTLNNQINADNGAIAGVTLPSWPNSGTITTTNKPI